MISEYFIICYISLYIGHINYNLNVSHFETEDGLLYDLNWYLILFDYCFRITILLERFSLCQIEKQRRFQDGQGCEG